MPDLSPSAQAASEFFSGSAAPILQGAGGLLGSYLNYKYQKRLMKRQNQYNIDMWKMQAEYNSPQAQMQRFQEAGLNPNLIYGQGSSGNMNSAPQMSVPDAPNYSRGLEELSKAFNIENLRTVIANRKKAEQEARDAKTNADRNYQAFEGEKKFGLDYVFDGKTGRYVPVDNTDEVEVIAYPYARTKYQSLLADNFHKNVLIPYRVNLLNAQKKVLAPQIQMLEYEAKNKKAGYWIGQGTKIINSLGNFIPVFSPVKWSPRPFKPNFYYR